MKFAFASLIFEVVKIVIVILCTCFCVEFFDSLTSDSCTSDSCASASYTSEDETACRHLDEAGGREKISKINFLELSTV